MAAKQPKSVGAHTMVAMILQGQGKRAEARARYEQILRIDPRAAVAANNLAWMIAEDQSGDIDMALELAQTAKIMLPGQPEVNDTVGWIYYKKDLPALAIAAIRLSIEKDPNNPIYHYHLGLAYAKSNEPARARASIEHALKLKPDFQGADQARNALASLIG